MAQLPNYLQVSLWHDTIDFTWTPPLVAEVTFHWWSYPRDLARAIRASNVNAETYGDREHLERVFAVILELPVAFEDLPEVTSFRFVNPAFGFVYEDECTQRIEGDREWMIRHAARMASGQKMEYGHIEYNRSLRYDHNAEAKMTGDIAVSVPEEHHGTYKLRVRPLVEQSLSGAAFEYRISEIDGLY